MASTRQAHTVISRSTDDTIRTGEALGIRLRTGDVVALHGDVGAGKTTFVHGIVRGVAGGGGDIRSGDDPRDHRVTSPTFSIVNTYDTGDVVVHHVDAFRVASDAELAEMGFGEYFDGSAVVIVEWPSRVLSWLPPDTLHLTFERVDETTRRITEHDGAVDGL